MIHLAQCRKLSGSILIGYLKQGKIVQHRRNGQPYDSPSAARRAAESWLEANPKSGHYFTIVPDKPRKECKCNTPSRSSR